MKKPIVGEAQKAGVVVWYLDRNIEIFTDDTDPKYAVWFDGDYAGEIWSKQMVQELFQVILYPPGSEPSPESADPTDKYRMREEKERQYEIPRADILNNGDWN